jgi:hypothetical protein
MNDMIPCMASGELRKTRTKLYAPSIHDVSVTMAIPVLGRLLLSEDIPWLVCRDSVG